ncbi:hypothetical protein [Orbus mooreae]|uniref:hypothetical protein n=1 Tax=Orbus mooreae TaxID=3074107 RepID=UPI00370D7B05
MKLNITEYVPTLNEFLKKNKDNTDPMIKTIVNDFYDFPESANDKDESANLFKNQRDILLKSANQRINDIIMVNRYALVVYNSNVEQIAPFLKKENPQYDEFCNIFMEQSEDIPIEEARLSRNFDTVCEIYNARKIADEGMIVHLWATIEQHVNKAFLIMGGDESRLSYRWNQLKDGFTELGVTLETLPSYKTIDEIRVVNNKIKHLYIVDDELCKYDGFAKYKGKKMSLLDYRTHDYALAAHHFINRLVMNMGPTISYGHGCE